MWKHSRGSSGENTTGMEEVDVYNIRVDVDQSPDRQAELAAWEISFKVLDGLLKTIARRPSALYMRYTKSQVSLLIYSLKGKKLTFCLRKLAVSLIFVFFLSFVFLLFHARMQIIMPVMLLRPSPFSEKSFSLIFAHSICACIHIYISKVLNLHHHHRAFLSIPLAQTHTQSRRKQ